MIDKRFDILAGTGFLAIGAFFVTASTGITQSSYGSKVGPSAFPMLLGILLIMLSLMVIYGAAKLKGEGKAPTGRKYARLAILIAATIAYIVIFEPLGYVISTFLFLTFVFQLMERKALLKSVLISAVFSGVVYVAYVSLLQGTLPPFPDFLTALAGGG